jgi:hypothetical protein
MIQSWKDVAIVSHMLPVGDVWKIGDTFLQWFGFVFFHVQQWLIIGDTIGSIGAKKNRVFLNGFYQQEPTIIGDDYAGTWIWYIPGLNCL